MHRTMIMLPKETHKNLKRLAVEREVSLAEIIREAVENQYREDLEDMADARHQLARHKPGTWGPYRDFVKALRGK